MILRAPIRNFRKLATTHARGHAEDTHITQNEQTPCFPCPMPITSAAWCYTALCTVHGYLHRKSMAQRMMRSDQSRTRYFPWKSAQRRRRRGDDHHQTMMCVPYAYHFNRLLIAISMSTIIRIERDIKWYTAIWTEHCSSSPVIWLNVVGDVVIAIRHNNRRIQQSKSYRCQ